MMMMIDDFAVSDQLWVRLLAVSHHANRLSMGFVSAQGLWFCVRI